MDATAVPGVIDCIIPVLDSISVSKSCNAPFVFLLDPITLPVKVPWSSSSNVLRRILYSWLFDLFLNLKSPLSNSAIISPPMWISEAAKATNSSDDPVTWRLPLLLLTIIFPTWREWLPT